MNSRVCRMMADGCDTHSGPLTMTTQSGTSYVLGRRMSARSTVVISFWRRSMLRRPRPTLRSGWKWHEMETEFAYFCRRAFEERRRALLSSTRRAREAHLVLAAELESLGRAIDAKERREQFCDVNAPQSAKSSRPCDSQFTGVARNCAAGWRHPHSKVM